MLRILLLLATSNLNISFHYWTPPRIRSFRKSDLHDKTCQLAALPDTGDLSPGIRKSNGFYSKAGTGKPMADASLLNRLISQDVDIYSPNLVKISLLEDLKLEKIRVEELNNLLDTFYDIIDEKEQAISIDDDLLMQMCDNRGKVSDSLLSEFDSSSEGQSAFLDLQRAMVQNISAIASSLALEIYDTGEMIKKSEESMILLPDFMNSTKAEKGEEKSVHLLQSRMQKSIRSFRYTRDERILHLINQFDDFNDRNESQSLRDSIMHSMENDAYPLAIAQNAPYRLHESELMGKTNPEIAYASIRTVGIAVMSLVAITSSLITASSESITSEEARTSADITSVALADFGDSLKGTIIAFQSGRTGLSNGSEEDDSRQGQLIESQSQGADAKEVAGLLGSSIVQVARGSTNTVGIVSSKIRGWLQKSSKWQNATSDLVYSLELMLSILKLSVNRVVCAIKAEEKEPYLFEES